MKQQIFALTSLLLITYTVSGQVKAARPLAQKTVVASPSTEVKPVINPRSSKTENPPPKPTNLQKAIVNVVSGDDGKDDNTLVEIHINDDNQREAATASDDGKEYLPGENQTIDGELKASEYTGQIDNSKYPPLAITREATLADFANGGSIDARIDPMGNDTWKLTSLSVTLFFNNDPGSPHKVTWTGFTLTQNNRTKHLEFDKNFNPIQ